MIPATRADPFCCIILGAGAGTRFGGPKALARLPSGERFLDAVVDLAAMSGASPILAVVPPGVETPAPAQAVVNPNGGGEQIASVRLALTRLLNSPALSVLLWPVDHPVVLLDSVLAIVDGFKRTRAPIVLPTYGGRRGHPGLFARETWRDLMTVEDGGARAVIGRYGPRVLDVTVTDAGVLRDVDTIADLPKDGWRSTDALP